MSNVVPLRAVDNEWSRMEAMLRKDLVDIGVGADAVPLILDEMKSYWPLLIFPEPYSFGIPLDLGLSSDQLVGVANALTGTITQYNKLVEDRLCNAIDIIRDLLIEKHCGP